MRKQHTTEVSYRELLNTTYNSMYYYSYTIYNNYAILASHLVLHSVILISLCDNLHPDHTNLEYLALYFL